MVSKNHEIKTKRYSLQKLLYYTILAVYAFGVLRGCVFALKNSDNPDFILKVTFTGNMVENENISRFSAYAATYIRDMLSIVMLLVLKYSGIQRGLCLCVPFTVALQNSGMYIVNYTNGMGILEMISGYIIKDTAAAFLTVLFCYVIAWDIIQNRYNVKRDIQKLTVYFSGITVVYILDFVIKFFIL